MNSDRTERQLYIDLRLSIVPRLPADVTATPESFYAMKHLRPLSLGDCDAYRCVSDDLISTQARWSSSCPPCKQLLLLLRIHSWSPWRLALLLLMIQQHFCRRSLTAHNLIDNLWDRQRRMDGLCIYMHCLLLILQITVVPPTYVNN